MKKLFFLGAFALLVLTSCSEDDEIDTVNVPIESPSNSIVGIWNPSKMRIESGANQAVLFSVSFDDCQRQSTYDFDSYGTVTSKLYESDSTCQSVGTETVNYSYDHSSKILTYDGDQIPVVTLTTNTLEFEDVDFEGEDFNGDGTDDKKIITFTK